MVVAVAILVRVSRLILELSINLWELNLIEELEIDDKLIQRRERERESKSHLARRQSRSSAPNTCSPVTGLLASGKWHINTLNSTKFR